MDQLPRPKTSDGNAQPEGSAGARVIRLARPHGTYSRETLAQWRRWIDGATVRRGDLVSTAVVALALHGLLVLVLFSLPDRKAYFDLDARNRQVKVTFFDGRGKPDEPSQKGEEVTAPRVPAGPATPRAAPRGAAGVRTREKTAVAAPAKKAPLVRNPGAMTKGPFAVPVPEVAANATPSPGPLPDAAGTTEDVATTQVAPPSTSKGLKNLLPGGSRAYLERQRTIGDVMGQGPVGGDVPESRATPDPEKRPVVVEREYALSHYFDNLSRRFSDAWGPERTLPPNSSFAGVTGEFIEYDIVINRDGSLRKITNVTSLRQPWRRFEDVDRIVLDVFSNVFPLAEVPARILQDPVVIRKRIQYTGYRYSIF